MFNQKSIKVLFFTAVFISFPVILNALSINQIINLKSDGSGILNFTYFEKDDIIKQKNNIIGNLPFTKEKLAEYFKAPNSYIQLSKIEKNPKDNSQTQVVVIISFTDISKLGDAKGLTDIIFSLDQTDSGRVFKNIIKPEFVKGNLLNQIFLALNSESEIKSANGKITGKSVNFFRGKDFIDGKNSINFIATIEGGSSNTSSNGSSLSGEKEKSCGLFGIELPFILISGLAFIFSRKKSDS